MTPKKIALALVVVFLAYKGAKEVVHYFEPPTCHSDAATHGLSPDGEHLAVGEQRCRVRLARRGETAGRRPPRLLT